VVPFGIFVILFLLAPMVAVAIGAFQDNSGNFTFSNVHAATHGIYLHGFWQSILLSVISAVLPGILGLILAYAIVRAEGGNLLRQIAITAAGVFANFGGVPLAFIFIATIGSSGLVNQWLTSLGFDPYNHGFTLYSLLGVVIVYLYFQIPLMVLVIAPAVDGLKREWREAASNLGAKPWQFWRHVGIPVLMPSILGATILLFGNSFAAYATAYSLTSGALNLIPIMIGAYYQGNVLSNPHLAQAMAFGMFVVLALMMVIYIPLQRRAARWAR
jgi:putative spermidine/putrescine transport system permease protein